MKKIISVFLAMLLAFSALSVAASALGGEYQTYYINYELADDTIKIVPVEGYNQYVLPGEDFKFTVETTEGYSDVFVIVQLDTVEIEPDVHGVYTIENVSSDHTIKAFLSIEENQSNLFASLIVFVRNIMEWFANIIESLFKSQQT
jgi:hypothetical protein